MRICVDADQCEGHNRCYALAPELFEVDDLGVASALNDGHVPAGLEDKARSGHRQLPGVCYHNR